MATKKKVKIKKKTIGRKPTKRTGGGSKLARTEIVQVRLDPKLRFGAELAARKQRRTLSSFIEWSIGEAIKTVELYNFENKQMSASIGTDKVWDVHASDRFVKLAREFPNILNHEEEVLWKFIRENSFLWLSPDSLALEGEEWLANLNELDFIRFREVFSYFKKFARGEIKKKGLPILKETDSQFSEDFFPSKKEK